MPRISFYKIVLSPEEALELVARASKYTLPYFKVIRAKMILLAGQQPTLEDMFANREYLQRLAIAPYGDGFMKMLLSRGIIALGYSPVTPSLL